MYCQNVANIVCNQTDLQPSELELRLNDSKNAPNTSPLYFEVPPSEFLAECSGALVEADAASFKESLTTTVGALSCTSLALRTANR